MNEFSNRVAVVTGAASGIGRAMAERFAAEGMKIVLADVEEAALAKTAQEMKASGAEVFASRTDVADAKAVEALAEAVYSRFAAAHIVCNNAGVASRAVPCWEQSLEDWQWVLGVNLWGVIHGIRAFVPRMIAGGEEGHIVNTASVAGLSSSAFLGPYHASKHAVVTISECLYYELAAAESKLHASVLCPAWVNTRIGESGRNRPLGPDAPHPVSDAVTAGIRKLLAAGLSPESVAARVFEAVHEERFWILTHPEWNPAIAKRVEDMLARKNPEMTSQTGLK